MVPELDADTLGVPVHGPAVIARSTGVAMAARCIFARSEPELVVEMDDRRAIAYSQGQSNESSGGEFSGELRVGVANLPSDGVVTLTASWPQAGLAAGSVTLTLESLEGLEDRVIRLP